MGSSNSVRTGDRRGAARAAILLVLAWPMAAFFVFVGWYKAFASMAELASHGAWTAHVPAWIGRPMGWTEMLGAVVMAVVALPAVPAVRLLRGPAAWAAVWLAASQIVSAAVHVTHGEAAALPQNVFLFVALLVIAWLCRTPADMGARR